MMHLKPPTVPGMTGKLDVSVMAKYLEELLKGQLTDK
jgi:hypothetical protein